MAAEGGGGGLAGVFGQWFLQFFGDTKGLSIDLDKMEAKASKTASHIENTFAKGFNAGIAQAREGMGSMTEFMGGWAGKITAFLSSPVVAIAGIAAAIGAFTISAVQSSLEFEKSFKRVKVVLAGTGEDLDALRDRLIHDITPSMATAGEEAASLANVLAVGFKPEESLKILDTAAKLSRVTGVDLNTSTRLLTDTLRSYNMEAREVTHVSNIMAGVFAKAGGPEAIGELQMALGRVLPLARELGIPLEQVAAALIAARQQGVSTGRAAMALAAILGRVTSTAQEFRDVNVDIYNVARTRGIAGVLAEFRRVSGGTIEDLRELNIENRTLNTVMSLSGDKAQLMVDALEKLGSMNLDKLKEQTEGVGDATIELKDAWEDIKLSVGNVAIPVLAAVAKTIAQIPKQFTKQPAPLFDREGLAQQRAGERDLAAGAEETAQAVEKTAEVSEKAHKARMADVQSAEIAFKSMTEEQKVRDDAAQRSLQLDKQIAQERKATEVELLTFDKRIAQERFNAEQQRRDLRLQIIDVELQELRRTQPEENKLRMQLEDERTRLAVEGTNARAIMEKETTALHAREISARQKLDESHLASARAMGLTRIQDELNYWQQRMAMAKRGSEEEIKAAETIFKKQQELRDQARSGLGGMLSNLQEWAKSKGVESVNAFNLDSLMSQYAAEMTAKMGRMQAGGGGTWEEWQQALKAAPFLEQYSRGMREFGDSWSMAQKALSLEPSREANIWGMGASSVAQAIGSGTDFQAALAPVQQIPGTFKAAMDESVKMVDEGFKKMQETVRTGSGVITQDIYVTMKGMLIREIREEFARS